MENKPNLSSINFYAEKYASVICNHFFRTKDAINGKEILDITPTRQINFFAVKIIFQSWLQETKKLQSPFFDYNSQEVQQSLNTLMNHLSRNIRIEFAEFKPLLRTAVAESLHLMLFPSDYFQELFNTTGKRLQYETEVKPLLKYIKTHEKLCSIIQAEMEKEGRWLKKKDALEIIGKLVKENQNLLDSPYEMIRELNELVPVGIFELAPNWQDPSVLKEVEEIEKKASASPFDFEALYNRKEEEKERIKDTPPPAQPIVPKEEKEPQVTWGKPETSFRKEEPKAPENPPIVQEQETRKAPVLRGRAEFAPRREELYQDEPVAKEPPKPIKKEDPIDNLIKQNTSVPYFKKEDFEEEEEDTTPKGSLLEKLAKEASSINQQKTDHQAPAPKKTLLDSLAQTQKKVTRKSLKDSVPLNMKILFQKELFRNDESAYENALSLIDQAADYHSALAMLKQKYWYEYSWDLENDATVQFLSMMDNHF